MPRFLRHYVTSLKTRTKEQLLETGTLLIHGGNAKNRAFLHSHIVCVRARSHGPMCDCDF